MMAGFIERWIENLLIYAIFACLFGIVIWSFASYPDWSPFFEPVVKDSPCPEGYLCPLNGEPDWRPMIIIVFSCFVVIGIMWHYFGFEKKKRKKKK